MNNRPPTPHPVRKRKPFTSINRIPPKKKESPPSSSESESGGFLDHPATSLAQTFAPELTPIAEVADKLIHGLF